MDLHNGNETNSMLKWSWASIDGPIAFYKFLDYRGERALCTVESVTLYNPTADIYGEVLHAKLIMKGQLLKCENTAANLDDPTSVSFVTDLVLVPLGYTGSFDTNGAYLGLDSNLGVDRIAKHAMYILPISKESGNSHVGLILLRTGRARYTRCGLFDSLQVISPFKNTFVRPGKGGLKETISEQNFWEALESRTAMRDEARKSAGLEPFEVTYVIGPPPPENQNASQHGTEEYDEFDGEDYVFTLV